MKDDVIRRSGVVTRVFGATYEVQDDQTGIKVLCTLNGKMRMHSIKLVVGDKVDMDISTYDLTKGRVVYRKK